MKKQAERQNILKSLQETASLSIKRSIEVAMEKEASIHSCLTVPPIQQHDFQLHQADFRNAICLRYRWPLEEDPLHYPCRSNFGINHVIICPKGSFPTFRHNEVRDITADLLSDICSNVAVETHLHDLSGENLHWGTANSDVSAREVWRRDERAPFFDIMVFYPTVPSYRRTNLQQVYRNHKQENNVHTAKELERLKGEASLH